MKKLLIVATALCLAPAAANATYYNATFDCGRGQIVWIGNPVKGPFGSKERGRKVIFQIELSDFDFNVTPVMKSPVIRWNVKTDAVTSDGRRCREMTEDEVKELNKFEEGED